MDLRKNNWTRLGTDAFSGARDWRAGGPGNRRLKRSSPRAWILTSDWCGGSPTAHRNQNEENPDAVQGMIG